MEKVIAVVVTYNRQALLSECIAALQNQTRKPDTILVVNNGSTDATEAWLHSQRNIIFITQQNTGGAGGFQTGIRWAQKHGYAWVWCMDDDGYPNRNALEELLKIETPQRSLLNCAVIDKENKREFVWKTGNYKTIDEVEVPLIPKYGHPFNGTLIHRSIIEKVGLPKAGLFLWGDETEFYYRIVNRYKIPVYTVTKSIHYHPACNFTHWKDWDFNSSWKLYYYLRNRLYINKARFSTKLGALLHYCLFIIAFAGIVLVYQKTDRMKKLSFMLRPVTDAMKNDLTATPQVIINRMSKESAKHGFFPWSNSLKSFYQNLLIPQSRSKTATA